MKHQAIDELLFGKIRPQKAPKKFVLLVCALLLLTIIPLYYPSICRSLFVSKTIDSNPLVPSPSSSAQEEDLPSITSNLKCDIFTGEWVPNPEAPYYTNKTCWAIHEHQNCMKYGRPDTEFMKWKWKPDDCELPVFNPAQFLELLRGKSMAFVGDSVGRNQMQSMICLLSRVEYPIDVSTTEDQRFIRWKYTSYNFTMATFWTPHLVKSKEATYTDGPTKTGLFELYLDEFDEAWTTQINEFDYIILAAGHWFFRPMVYYENRKITGCNYCLLDNVPDLGKHYGHRKAFRTAFKAINSLENYKGITYVRTFAPSHFENGIWNEGGNCLRTKPYKSNETRLEGLNLELYMIQIEEFRKAEKEGRKKGLKYRLLDTTQATLLRPDGHPSRYGHWPNENVTLYNDCVHWCLPGPIDTWSDFLLEMLKMEGMRSAEEKKHLISRDRRSN
ncbi:protein trichome birefringence-like 19 [Pyrus x bretschneideri]|uniref:protein trichome birefringence-like 19 n=1 Tax=Pyrus x bretschneideri TaxID=225117 RepID=UPI00202E6CDB|nr:protein trichome birefringence-like 19 [Pyrus x bretschneideri]